MAMLSTGSRGVISLCLADDELEEGEIQMDPPIKISFISSVICAVYFCLSPIFFRIVLVSQDNSVSLRVIRMHMIMNDYCDRSALCSIENGKYKRLSNGERTKLILNNSFLEMKLISGEEGHQLPTHLLLTFQLQKNDIDLKTSLQIFFFFQTIEFLICL